MQNLNASGRFDSQQEPSNVRMECRVHWCKTIRYSNSQARKACACIKSNYVVSGWEEDVWRKVKRGDTSDWRTGALMNRMKAAINKCAKANNI